MRELRIEPAHPHSLSQIHSRRAPKFQVKHVWMRAARKPAAKTLVFTNLFPIIVEICRKSLVIGRENN
jgi:hypothetical protein